MRKFFFSLMTLSLLFASCSNDDNVTDSPNESRVGSVEGVLTFESSDNNVKAMSTAIPVTSWNNIKQIQMFLYNATTGKVAYSYTLTQTQIIAQADKKFTWNNIPVGTYDLAIVANMKSSTDNIKTSLDGGTTAAEWTNYNVKGRNINSQIFADLKPVAAFPSAYEAKKKAGEKPFTAPSEIFTAYASGVTINEGVPTNLTSTPLTLKREVALMRVRVNRSLPKLANINFADASASILLQRQPVGFGLKLGAFAGGITSTPSDINRFLIGASGTSTFSAANPTTTTHNPTTIVDSKFTLWKEVVVLPNATKADNLPAGGKVPGARKYRILISGLAPANYVLDDGTKLTTATPLFWSGVISEVFSPNYIREVNLTLTSSGSITPPDLEEEGGLTILVGAPENWAAAIQESTLEV